MDVSQHDCCCGWFLAWVGADVFVRWYDGMQCQCGWFLIWMVASVDVNMDFYQYGCLFVYILAWLDGRGGLWYRMRES